MKRLVKDRKGIVAVNAVLTIIVVLFIAGIIMSQLGHQATTIAQNLNDTGAVTYIENVKSMGWNALYLFTVSIIIVASMFIITIVNRMGGGSGGP